MDKSQKVGVKNRSHSTVIYSVPDLRVRREFSPGETKQIAFEELEALTYRAGGLNLIRDCLLIEDEGMAKQLIYTAKNIKAAEAYRIGLVNAVYPLEELMPAAEKMAAGIAKQAPIAVRASKAAINEGLQVDMDQAIVIEEKAFGSCFETEDQKYGMAFFLDKNKEKVKEPFQNK